MFGEWQLRPKSEGLRFIPLLVATAPQQIVHSETFSAKSKLSMIVVLLKRGWGHSDFLLESWVDGAAKLFDARTSKPSSYFSCLIARESLAKKGVREIKHHAPDAYYHCLLRCSAHQIAEMLQEGEMTNTFFLQQLQGVVEEEDSDIELLDLDAEILAGLDAQDATHEDASVGPMLALPVNTRDLYHRRCVVHVGGNSAKLKIFFDRGTHQSGRPRAWANCEAHGCIKCMFVDDFDDKRGVCSWLYAWWTTFREEEETKENHLTYEPLAEHVFRFAGQLQMEDF